MKEPIIYERSASISGIISVLERLINHPVREGDASVSLEGIQDFGEVSRLFSMLEKNSGELSLKKEEDRIRARSLITRKVSDISGTLSFIREMTGMREVRELRLNLILTDGTKITTYRFSDNPDNHTLYVIGREEVVEEISRILGEKKVKMEKEIEEESEEYCVYCGSYKGKKKTCPGCGR